MRKIKKTVLVFLLVLALIIQHLNIVDVTKAAESTRQLSEGDYLYLIPGVWDAENPVVFLRYNHDGSGNWKYIKMQECRDKEGNKIFRVKFPKIWSTGEFMFIRTWDGAITDGYAGAWDDDCWNQSNDLRLSDAQANSSNTYKITGWAQGKLSTGTWTSGEDAWTVLNYAGKQLFFYNTDANNNPITEVKATFFKASDTSETNTANMTQVSGNANLWSVTIPGGDDYDTVRFKDSDDNQLAETLILGGDYNPDSSNTYYYNRSILADNTTISTFGELITSSNSIADKTLYLDRFSFRSDNGEMPTIKIGDGQAVTLSKDATDTSVYSYKIPADSNATTQTVITLTYKGNTYNFFWDDINKDSLGLAYNIASVSGKYTSTPSEKKAVYFDATLSKLHYSDANIDNRSGDFGIPRLDGTIRYFAIDDSGNKDENDMKKVPAFMIGNHTYSDVYVAYIPTDYTKIAFSSFDMENSTNYGGYGESTTQLTIPTDLSEPCFYANTSDGYIYNSANGGQRGGYWSSIGTVRDPDVSNGSADIVDIPTETQNFSNDTLYINSTFYDYYSDYELNGNNRDDYPHNDWGLYDNNRFFQQFRQFNQALSFYYKDNRATWPLYWGNFQKKDGLYNKISSDLNLYGYANNTNKFFYMNNSMCGINGDELGDSSNVTQGLVKSELSNGNLMIETDGGDIVEAPYFSKSFIEGDNSKNVHLGKVYENVSFPFEKAPFESSSYAEKDEGGTVDYWYFDSAKGDDTDSVYKSLRMSYDNDRNLYFLNPSKDLVKGTSGKSNFFPFNGGNENDNQSEDGRRLNYGFATKLEFKFRLTDDGMVTNTKGVRVPIEFNFSGDDDIWIFVDGKLVLDLGGDHGIAEGYINFSGDELEKTSHVNKIKKNSDNEVSNNKTFAIEGSNTDEHTLTLFYMERGLFESNMSLSFNFPDANYFEVEKEVDESEVNDSFKGLFDNYPFYYSMSTLATHYGVKAVDGENNSILTGFVTNQWDIPDYGSATTGKLEIPIGAKYKSNKSDGLISIGSENSEQEGLNDYQFKLTNGENIIFIDQFRKGSYIYLNEKENELFETSYTMYEDDMPVTMFNKGESITLNDNVTSLIGVKSSTVNDGRIEKVIEGDSTYNEKTYPIKNAYKDAKQPIENEAIVYRSYLTPDSEMVHTRLKVVYTNKVKIGSIKLTKAKAFDIDNLEGDYTFTITFRNVGGENLEGDNVITKSVTLKNGESTVIEGIPIKTKFIIAETSSDSSSLYSIEEANNKELVYDTVAGTITGTIPENGEIFDLTFKNTLKPLKNVVVNKEWKDMNGTPLTENLPDSINVQLQKKEGENGEFEKVEDAVLNKSNNWTYTFASLDKYVDYTVNEPIEWNYRVVEVFGDVVVENNGLAGDYKVTYNQTDTAGALIQTIINTYIPKTIIKVVKSDATNPEIKLKDVEFKLERLNADDTVDTTFNEIVQSTDESGITKFSDLEEGKYRLTETNTNDDYILLKEPITIVINRSDGNSTINGKECTVTDDTITVNVTNTKKFVFPVTGGYGNTIYFMAGFILIWMAGFTYKILRLRRKSYEEKE